MKRKKSRKMFNAGDLQFPLIERGKWTGNKWERKEQKKKKSQKICWSVKNIVNKTTRTGIFCVVWRGLEVKRFENQGHLLFIRISPYIQVNIYASHFKNIQCSNSIFNVLLIYLLDVLLVFNFRMHYITFNVVKLIMT